MTTSAERGLMERTVVDGVELEYESNGPGEPVLLIPPGPVAGGFLPLLSEQALVHGRKGALTAARGAPRAREKRSTA